MFQKTGIHLINHMRLHTRKSAVKYSAEYGKVWTKEITPRTKQDIQLYGWFHNYPYHNQNDLTWWADRRRPRHTLANYALGCSESSIFAGLLRSNESVGIHKLSIGGKTTLLLPTNAAFTDLEFLEKLRYSPKLCSSFILSHIIPGEMTVRAIAAQCRHSKKGGAGVKTVGGKVLQVKVSGSLESFDMEIRIGEGRVLNHGIKCSNGVIIVLDSLV